MYPASPPLDIRSTSPLIALRLLIFHLLVFGLNFYPGVEALKKINFKVSTLASHDGGGRLDVFGAGCARKDSLKLPEGHQSINSDPHRISLPITCQMELSLHDIAGKFHDSNTPRSVLINLPDCELIINSTWSDFEEMKILLFDIYVTQFWQGCNTIWHSTNQMRLSSKKIKIEYWLLVLPLKSKYLQFYFNIRLLNTKLICDWKLLEIFRNEKISWFRINLIPEKLVVVIGVINILARFERSKADHLRFFNVCSCFRKKNFFITLYRISHVLFNAIAGFNVLHSLSRLRRNIVVRWILKRFNSFWRRL